jgi:hypothetical protein
LSGGEVVVASAISTLAIAVLASYLVYRPGWRVHPTAILVAALAGGAAIALRLRRDAEWRAAELATVAGIVLGVGAPLLSMAWPERLPVGGGPDLTHHLVLVNYIERHWQLIVDPSLVPYLGDMIYYTPGSHLLFALVGAWSSSDGLHVVHATLAAVVALKAGLVFCVAWRMLPPGDQRTAFAVAAVVLLFLPYEYVVGSFAHDSFWAQIVAETFACAAWWAIVVWDERPSTTALALFALFGAATFVTWPIWIGPLVLSLVVVAALRHEPSARTRLSHLVLALGPIAIVAAMHLFGRLVWLRIAGTSGAVIRPSPAISGWTFVALSAAGIILLTIDRRGRAAIVLLAAILVQSLALLAVANARGADTPYLALKMMYLVPYPLAIAAACALAAIWRLASPSGRFDRLAWIAVALVGAAVARRAALMPRPAPIVTESTYQAGRWARDHVAPACVDYLVADGYTGYWLHLAVLDNPRTTPRMGDNNTFEPRAAFARWIETDGLPYAIVDDERGFSKALFSSTDTLARFGRSLVIKRHGASTCQAAGQP